MSKSTQQSETLLIRGKAFWKEGTSPEHPVVVLVGQWRQDTPLQEAPAWKFPGTPKSLAFDCTGMEGWDSSLLVFIRRLAALAEQNQVEMLWDGLPAGLRRLEDLAGKARPPVSELPSSNEDTWFQKLGMQTMAIVKTVEDVLDFFGEFCMSAVRMLTLQFNVPWRDVGEQLLRTGPKALGIVSLISFLMGLVLAFIGAIPLQMFGADVYIAMLLGIGLLRLLVPVMVGVVIAGRTGAAYAAELGTMQVNEELDAFKTLGISPMEYLVMPRSLALTIMMPPLCVYADIVGVLGGLTVALFKMNLTALEFFTQLISSTSCRDLLVGLFTCLVFGLIVSVCGCYQGMTCGRSAESVGKATTAAVVNSIIYERIATAVITILTTQLHI